MVGVNTDIEAVTDNPLHAHREGFWTKTSSVEWCEKNYVISFYIAEFWNSFSSLSITLMSSVGFMLAYKEGLDSRYLLLYVVLGFVGIGSFLFHATLQWQSQLLDELPMIYVTFCFMYNFLEGELKPKFGLLVPVLLFVFACVFTFIYTSVYFSHTFFLLTYGSGVTYIIIKCFLMRSDPVIRNMFTYGIFAYLGGFTLWNIDREFCSLVEPFYFHAWWHLLSGIGTYLAIIAVTYEREKRLHPFDEWDIASWYGFPYVTKNVYLPPHRLFSLKYCTDRRQH